MQKPKRLFLLHWMSFACEAGLLPEPVERLIADGVQISESDLNAVLNVVHVPTGYCEVIKESALLISGQTQLLFDSVCNLSNKPCLEMTHLEKVIWAERVFLAGLAEHRLGRPAQRYWKILREALVLLPADCHFVETKMSVEKAAMDMNRGRFETAIESLALLGNRFFDVYTSARAQGIYATSFTEMGRFQNAESALLKEQKLLLHPRSKPLQLANQCRRISWLIEQELLTEAEILHAKAFENRDWSPNSHALLLKLKIQIGILKHDTAQVAFDFDALFCVIKKFNIHSGFISVSEEQCGFFLLKNSVESMIAELKEIVWQASLHGNKRLECIAKLFTARAQHRMGLRVEATESLEMSLSIADKNKYEKLRLKILFQLMCNDLNAGNESSALNFLLQIQPIVQQKKYRILFAGCQYLAAVASMKTGFEGLLVQLRSHFMKKQLHALFFTNALEIKSLIFNIYRDKKHLLSCSESEAIDFVASHEGIFLIGGNIVASRPFDETIVVFDPANARVICQIAKQFVMSSLVTKEFVHRLNYESNYSSYKHDERIRVTMARCNKDLMNVGLKFVFDKKRGHYVSDRTVPAFTLVAKLNERSGQNSAKSAFENKKDAILLMIRQIKKVTTTQMCGQLQMTRQSLFIYLKALVKEGQVQLVRFGPKSYYIPTAEDLI